jgi:hypothetical protein
MRLKQGKSKNGIIRRLAHESYPRVSSESFLASAPRFLPITHHNLYGLFPFE